jgi:uncharacterized membrane protein YtjA (UPF0391 family)
MTVRLKPGGRPGRRWKLLLLAAAVGFVGRGGIAAKPAAMLGVLLALFVLVFLVALAISMLSDPAEIEPVPESGSLRPSYPESVQVSHEAAFGSS